MEPIHRQTFEITAHHTDCFGRAKASVLLHFAQEAAGQHCLVLGTDWDALSKQHLFWAVIRQRMQITRLPVLGERLTVETWPMPTTRSAFPRSTVAYDENGREVFRAVSLWVLMDTRTRAMILPAKSGIVVEGALRGTELAAPGSIAPRTLHNAQSRSVCFTDLDRNGHMNNARYLDWIDDLLPSAYHKDHPVQELRFAI